jgi:hypothetical protein
MVCIHLDYKIAEHCAVNDIYLSTKVIGCDFHFKQISNLYQSFNYILNIPTFFQAIKMNLNKRGLPVMTSFDISYN